MTKGDLVVNKNIPQHVVYAKMEIVPTPQTGGRSESKSGVSGAKPLKKVFRKNWARLIQKIYY